MPSAKIKVAKLMEIIYGYLKVLVPLRRMSTSMKQSALCVRKKLRKLEIMGTICVR